MINSKDKTGSSKVVEMNGREFLKAYANIFSCTRFGCVASLKGTACGIDDKVMLLADGYVSQDSHVPSLPIYRVLGSIDGTSIEGIFYNKQKYLDFCKTIGLID